MEVQLVATDRMIWSGEAEMVIARTLGGGSPASDDSEDSEDDVREVTVSGIGPRWARQDLTSLEL